MGVVKVHIPEKAVKFILKKKQRLNTTWGRFVILEPSYPFEKW